MTSCPECGFQCDSDDAFCRSCGSRLPDGESSPETRTPWPVVLPIGRMGDSDQGGASGPIADVGMGQGLDDDVIDISLSDLESSIGPTEAPNSLVVSLEPEDMQPPAAAVPGSATPSPQSPLAGGGSGASNGSVPHVRPPWLWPALAAGVLVIAVGIGVGVHLTKDGSVGDVLIAPADPGISAQPSGEYYDALIFNLMATANLYVRQAWVDFQGSLSQVDTAYLESLEPHKNELVCDFIEGRTLDETINPREGDADATNKEVCFLVLGKSRYAVGTHSASGNTFGAIVDLTTGDSTLYTNGLEDRNGWYL